MKPLGIYIHWPFCQSKCPYCDFNSHVRQSIDHDLWQSCLLQELRYWYQHTQSHVVKTIFFGGGTPSLMWPQTVEHLINFIDQNWSCEPNIEITLEANPNSIDASKFRDFKAAGINRVSVGIQSFSEQDLKFLGRNHSKTEAINALNIAAGTFDNYSFDLIYARPNQTWEQWHQELIEIMPYARHHLSLYQLTIEPNTAFYTSFARGQYRLPENDIQAELYTNTGIFLKQHSLHNYEISNYAKADFQCAHNLIYWRYNDYLPVGPGAHGRLTLNNTKFAITNLKVPETWISSVRTHQHGIQDQLILNQQDQFYEALLMGLRLVEGIPLERLSTLNPLATEQLLNNLFLKKLYQ